jgi:hypothetical protein
MQQIAELKREFLRGNITKADVARQVNAIFHYYDIIEPEFNVEAADLPDEFFEPCDCIFCRAGAGQTPIPIEVVIAVENIRLVFRVGLISQFDALLEIQKILRRYHVTDEEAVKFWNESADSSVCGMAAAGPLKPEEEQFFKGLEEQMKDVPKEGK